MPLHSIIAKVVKIPDIFKELSENLRIMVWAGKKIAPAPV